MERKLHKLKTEPKYYYQVTADIKNFEIRINDRDYQTGDQVQFEEWTQEYGYSGRKTRQITIDYVLKNVPHFGLQEGYCIFGWHN